VRDETTAHSFIERKKMKSTIDPQLFCYAIPATLFVANTTTVPQINISSDCNFELFEIRCTQQAVGAILIQISMASGELFSNVALDSVLFSGTSYPVRLPFPVLIPANTQLNVSVQNTTGGNLTSQIQLWGFKRN
jgi:hypothetical protein